MRVRVPLASYNAPPDLRGLVRAAALSQGQSIGQILMQESCRMTAPCYKRTLGALVKAQLNRTLRVHGFRAQANLRDHSVTTLSIASVSFPRSSCEITKAGIT